MSEAFPKPIDRFFDNGLALEVMHLQQHAATAIHSHNFSELVIVLHGSGIHISPAGDYAIGAGDIFVLHGNQAHGYRDTSELELVNILFRLEELAIPLQDLVSLPGYHALFTLEPIFRKRDNFESRLRLSLDKLPYVADLVNRLATTFRLQAVGWRFVVTAYFMLLMADLSRCYSHLEEPAAQPLLRLGRVLGYLEQHYGDKLTLDDLAAVGHLSRRSLTREFRRALGCSPMEYLIKLRINHAMALLQDNRASVTGVAFLVGFQDSNYFARQFRAIVGLSPREYRKSRTFGAP